MQPPEIVERTVVQLRRVTPQDGTELFLAARDPEVMRYMDWQMPEHVTETEAHLQRADRNWDEGSEFQWVILEMSSKAVVGTISYRPKAHSADFGYFLARQHWGKGLAREAAAWVVGWLTVQPEVFRVWATADAENTRSRRLLESLGLRLEGVHRMATVRPNIGGPPRDTALYARCRNDA